MLDTMTTSPATPTATSPADPAASRIGALVAEILSRRGQREPVASGAELARFGMTSIDMVEVMLGVEAEFDLSIPPRDITLDNFRSVDAIASLVDRLGRAG